MKNKFTSQSQEAANESKENANLEALNYPPSQDIMNKEKRVDVDPEELSTKEVPYFPHKEIRPQNRQQADLDNGLDVPGAELDDADELIGEEDEENNFYSLGGDEKDHLEDDPSE